MAQTNETVSLENLGLPNAAVIADAEPDPREESIETESIESEDTDVEESSEAFEPDASEYDENVDFEDEDDVPVETKPKITKEQKLIRKYESDKQKDQNRINQLEDAVQTMADQQTQFIQQMNAEKAIAQENQDPLPELQEDDWITKSQMVELLKNPQVTPKESIPAPIATDAEKNRELTYMRRMPGINKIQAYINNNRNQLAKDPTMKAPTNQVGLTALIENKMLKAELKKARIQLKKAKGRVPPTSGGQHQGTGGSTGSNFGDQLANTLQSLGIPKR